jgi:hypothetical protein
MKKVFFLLGELDDDDIDWMVSSGRREEVEAGTVLIQKVKRLIRYTFS